MRHLFYTNYMSGSAGLSNAIMSIEVGVVLAHLTNRFLVLDGNRAPPANLVKYDGRVSNDRPSRVTDLIDIPVAWEDSQSVDLEGCDSFEMTDLPLSDVTFYFPDALDLSSDDARSFARGRDAWLSATEELDRIPLLRLSEDPVDPRTPHARASHRNNLGFYSYLFYLDAETRRSTYRVLERMRPKPAFAELANRVAADLGAFNAVHIRRGDFKVTYGVTTLDRQPWEAVETLDQVFDRKHPLVIVTDESDDPFFDEIKHAYPAHLFIDWHILDAYGADFAQLPQTDSLSLAYLSQLVAAESMNFIGTMTSTFTSIIQRYRGNRGKDEPFRFLWNELPEPDAPVARGRHGVSHCIPLDRGVMVEEHQGPYSWNRVSQRLNPAWMREWPESFLTHASLHSAALGRASHSGPDLAATVPADAGPLVVSAAPASAIYLTFENLQIVIRARDRDLLYRVARTLGVRPDAPAGNVIAEFEIVSRGARHTVLHSGERLGEANDPSELGALVKTLAVPVLAVARHRYTWLLGAAFARAGRAIVVAGHLGRADNSLTGALQEDGWQVLERGVVAIRSPDFAVVPFGVRAADPDVMRPVQTPPAGLVVAVERLSARDLLAPLSPAVAVATLIETSLDYRVDPDRATERLCRLVERCPVAQLFFSRAPQGVQLISRWAYACDGVGAS